MGQYSPTAEGATLLTGVDSQAESQAWEINDQERLTVASIYRPIQPKMVRVEQRLDGLIAGAPRGIDEMLTHALKGGGKRLRPALTLLAGSFHKGDGESLVSMATAIELLHTATLVHDDTIDDALLRRARLTVNRLWGSRDAVFVGDYLCAAAAYIAAETGNSQAMAVFSRTLSDLCSGAIGEYRTESHQCGDEYFLTVGRKTASLFTAATESGALLSRASRKVVLALRDYGYNLGMAFQIVDDIHDFGSDLSRGILNLPALLFLDGPQGDDIRRVLAQDRGKGLRLIKDGVEGSDVREECRVIARDFSQRACNALSKLPHNAGRESLIGLAHYLTERQG